MADEKFYRMVADMRMWQRKYFRTRTKETLIKSKEYEKDVDSFLKERGAQYVQQELFS